MREFGLGVFGQVLLHAAPVSVLVFDTLASRADWQQSRQNRDFLQRRVPLSKSLPQLFRGLLRLPSPDSVLVAKLGHHCGSCHKNRRLEQPNAYVIRVDRKDTVWKEEVTAQKRLTPSPETPGRHLHIGT